MATDTANNRSQTAKDYARKGHKRVIGHLPTALSSSVIALSELHKKSDLNGPVAEIGVHHGKFFLLLLFLTSPDEKGLAIDLFDRQEENIDNSGKGDKEILTEHLSKLGEVGKRAVIVQANSLELSPDEVFEKAGSKIRIFSVDGGHTAETTENDLRIACETLTDGGLIFLDDYFNPGWPAVSEGTVKYFTAENAVTNIVPFAIVGGKIVFTTRDKSEEYRQELLQAGIGTWKDESLFGNPVIVFEYQHSRILNVDYWKQTRLWQRIKNRPLAEKLRRIVLARLR